MKEFHESFRNDSGFKLVVAVIIFCIQNGFHSEFRGYSDESFFKVSNAISFTLV